VCLRPALPVLILGDLVEVVRRLDVVVAFEVVRLVHRSGSELEIP